MEAQTKRHPEHLKSPFSNCWVVVRGGGDIASGSIQRLRWAGFPVIVTELPNPLVVRRLGSFASAVYDGCCQVEGTPAQLVHSPQQAQEYIEQFPDGVPVLIDPPARVLDDVRHHVLIDGRMAKKPLDTHPDQAP